jgi:hypothetical protein
MAPASHCGLQHRRGGLLPRTLLLMLLPAAQRALEPCLYTCHHQPERRTCRGGSHQHRDGRLLESCHCLPAVQLLPPPVLQQAAPHPPLLLLPLLQVRVELLLLLLLLLVALPLAQRPPDQPQLGPLQLPVPASAAAACPKPQRQARACW